MFHGPDFQGVTELLAIADDHVRGVLTVPPAPGALLDNVGQLLGYWIMARYTTRRVVFPVGMGRIAFHGPPPPAGTRLECRIAIRSVTDGALTADAELIHNGRVWCAVDAWVDRRFDSHPDTHAVERFSDRNALAKPRPGGWALVFERWPDLASRDLVLRTYTNAAERGDYERCAARSRRQWLLGRIAAKDAVRQRIWALDPGPVFPAEIRVSNEDTGRPVVAGWHGYPLPPTAVSIAHRAEAGVAIAGTGPVGIDIEEVTERPAATTDLALTPAEIDLLATLGGGARWFTRFWAAKEAVAKAEGTGLGGQPRRFVVVRADQQSMTVRVGGKHYRVGYAGVHNPSDLPPREYVVAWTTGPSAGNSEEAR
jgi:phosphopantetheinyl transferase